MNKFYYCYALNPEQVITSNFDERDKIGCIVVDNGIELRELLTDAKFMQTKEGSVIDGKIIFENNASLIGILDREISAEAVVNFVNKSGVIETEYVNLLIKLIANTRKKAVEGIKEYYQFEKIFKEEINKNRK